MNRQSLDKSVLKNVIDIHVHTGPDGYRSRMYDDLSLAQKGMEFGMRGAMLKSHQFCTADRAIVANQLFEQRFRLFGGLALNRWTGGLNPYAVEAALALHADVIWLPTLHSALDRRGIGKPDGIEVVDGSHVVPELDTILRLMAQTNTAALATGHYTARELLIVVDRARELGVERIIINHPALFRMQMTIAEQRELAHYQVYFERCYGGSNAPIGHTYLVNVDDNIRAIRELGCASTIVASDLGADNTEEWTNGLANYIHMLYDAGFTTAEIDEMTKINPAKALNLDVVI